MASSRRTTVLVLLAGVLLGGAAWLASLRSDPGVGGANAANDAAPRDVARSVTTHVHADGPVPGVIVGEARETPSEDPLAREAFAAPPQPVLRVLLRGVDPNAPWTAPLRLQCLPLPDAARYSHEAIATPDANGRVSLELPPWWARCRHGSIVGKDDHYLPVEHRWMGRLDPNEELVLDVQATAVFTGRVVDSRGTVVHALVDAFLADVSIEAEIAVGTTTSDASGSWRMQAPPDRSLALFAQPIKLDGSPSAVGDIDHLVHTAVEVRLLPASIRARGRVGQVTDVGDLVLPDAFALSGSVSWTDGGPIAGAWVQSHPEGGTRLALAGSTFVQRHDDGRLSVGAQANTDAGGRFVLPIATGTTCDVQLLTLGEGLHLAAPGGVQSAAPPATIEFRLPRPIVFRATSRSVLEPGAAFELDRWDRPMRLEKGEMSVVPNASSRIRAIGRAHRSQWRDFGPADAGTTIDLDLGDPVCVVSITFDGTPPGICMIEWRSSDGRTGRANAASANGAAFTLALDAGTYRLSSWQRAQVFTGKHLLPFHFEFTASEQPVSLVVPVRYGGTLAVTAADSSGVPVTGSCRVLAANGDDVTDTFTLEPYPTTPSKTPGVLLPGSPNRLCRVLPPGDYELTFDFPAHGVRRERVTIREREVTEVRVRL